MEDISKGDVFSLPLERKLSTISTRDSDTYAIEALKVCSISIDVRENTQRSSTP